MINSYDVVKIRKAINNIDSYICGGFVRDIVAGESPRDLDIVFKSLNDRKIFINSLSSIGDEYNIQAIRTKDNKYPNYLINNSFILQKYVVKKDSVNVFTIDCLIHIDHKDFGVITPFDKKNLDFDINNLKLSVKNGVHRIELLFPMENTNLSTIMEKAAKKQFSIVNSESANKTKTGTDISRKASLIDRGWMISEPVISSIVHTSKSIFPNDKEGKVIMSEPKNKAVEAFKKGLENGAFLATTSHTTKLAKTGIIRLLQKKGADNATCIAIESALETEAGTALVHAMLGIACLYAPIPQIQNNEKVQKMAQTFIDQSMATGMETAIEIAMEALGPAILNIAGLEQQQLRVKDSPQLKEKVKEISDEELEILIQEKNRRESTAV